MTSLYFQYSSCQTSFSCYNTPDKVKLKLKIKVNGIPRITLEGNGLMFQTNTSISMGDTRRRSLISSVASMTETTLVNTGTKTRQNIPTKKQMVDPFRQGIIIDGGVGYRQTVVTRSYEVGADKTATLETILNLLQETALNHVWVSGLLGDGFGATHGMVRNNLIWVVSRMQVQVNEYPIWGEVTEVDTWVGASGKNGMRREWLIRSQATGQVLAQATRHKSDTWVMMNQQTRRLSKMPEEVRAEISPWFIEKKAIQEEVSEKIDKLDTRAKYINSNLKPKRFDLDMNHHVNNVKYVNWMLETIPHKLLENYQLSNITLEYRRECGKSDIVQSLSQPEDKDFELRTQDSTKNGVNGDSLASNLFQDCYYNNPLMQRYTHLLQMTGEKKMEEIARGRTTWKRKL